MSVPLMMRMGQGSPRSPEDSEGLSVSHEKIVGENHVKDHLEVPER